SRRAVGQDHAAALRDDRSRRAVGQDLAAALRDDRSRRVVGPDHAAALRDDRIRRAEHDPKPRLDDMLSIAQDVRLPPRAARGPGVALSAIPPPVGLRRLVNDQFPRFRRRLVPVMASGSRNDLDFRAQQFRLAIFRQIVPARDLGVTRILVLTVDLTGAGDDAAKNSAHDLTPPLRLRALRWIDPARATPEPRSRPLPDRRAASAPARDPSGDIRPRHSTRPASGPEPIPSRPGRAPGPRARRAGSLPGRSAGAGSDRRP